jgi:hypothetical protein
VEEGLDELFHRGLVAELAGVAFHWSEAGVGDDAVCEGRFAGARGAIEEGNDGVSWSTSGDPGQERIVVGLVEGGGPGWTYGGDFTAHLTEEMLGIV